MDVEKKAEQPLRSPPFSGNNQLHNRKRRKCIIIWSSVIGVILVIALILLILALTVFKPKKPILTVNSVAIKDLDVSLNPLQLNFSLNLSLALDLTIQNPNKVGVKYRSSSATLRYNGKDVGDVPIPAGSIGADGKKDMNLTLTVFADRLISDSSVYGDVLRGDLPFSTYTKIRAKVRVLFFRIGVVSTSTCDVNVDIQSRGIRNQTCHYSNKL